MQAGEPSMQDATNNHGQILEVRLYFVCTSKLFGFDRFPPLPPADRGSYRRSKPIERKERGERQRQGDKERSKHNTADSCVSRRPTPIGDQSSSETVLPSLGYAWVADSDGPYPRVLKSRI